MMKKVLYLFFYFCAKSSKNLLMLSTIEFFNNFVLLTNSVLWEAVKTEARMTMPSAVVPKK